MMLRGRRSWLGYCVVAVLIATSGIAWWHFQSQTDSNENARQLSFDGFSGDLKHTLVVPTLDSPIPEGKSVIWCASFQLAWNRLKNDVAKAPIQLTNAQPLADQLNVAGQLEEDVAPDDTFAVAGLAKDGIVKRIHSEMARRFPLVPTPELDVPTNGAVAYAYLAASAKYDYPFFENDEPFLFTDAAGKQTVVGSFGIRKKDEYAYSRLRQQVQILYRSDDETMPEKEVPEFVLDLCRTSQPYQIVIGRVNRGTSLAEILADAESKIAAEPARNSSPKLLRPRDMLLVPNLAWRVSHRFKEIEGSDKQFLNPALEGTYLDTALQTIQFRLDRSGAELASEAKAFVKPSASGFYLNRPFLVYMKKRDSRQPFFVMWVDNAELL